MTLNQFEQVKTLISSDLNQILKHVDGIDYATYLEAVNNYSDEEDAFHVALISLLWIDSETINKRLK